MTEKTTTKKTTTKKASAKTLSASVYDVSGKEVRKIELPEALFAAKKNDTLVHQVVVSMEANARTPVAHAKDRSEVRGGGKKPWKQKGTGRARHGSRRSPIWVGGGVAHGPTKDRDFSKKINKKMRSAALASVLSSKLEDGEIIFVDMPNFEAPKTKDAKGALESFAKVAGFESLATRRNNAALIALSGENENAEMSFRNMGNVATAAAKDLNPVSILSYRYLVVANPEEAIEALTNRMK